MSPHRIVPWHDAICDLITGKIEVIESYDEIVRSPSVEFQIPSVARLKRHIHAFKKGVKFSRINVMTRDDFQCCYCGTRRPMRELNYDHVTPRIQGGKTVWENIVTSCYPCNDKKSGRTPEQAGMRLLKKPYRPKTLPMTTPALAFRQVPDLWKPYLVGSGLAVAVG
jgi:5-methylcytosine-specific restriction endonuclease McrA